MDRNACDLSECTGRDEALATIAAYARSTDRDWIVGSGWSMAHFPGGCPQASDLDPIVGDRPVYLLNRDHHGAVVSACGGDREMAPSAPLTDQIEGRLNYYSWGDYENPDDLDQIQKEYGFTMQIDSYASNEEMVAKLAAARGTSGYDIVVPTGSFLPQMIDHELLEPLDLSRIPNLSNLLPQFTDTEWDPGNRYAVCKDWGTTGYLYDTTAIPGDLTSWGDFVEAAKGPANGKVSILGDPIEVCSIANGALGFDIQTTDPAQLDQVKQLLVEELAPTIRGYNSNISSVVPGGDFTLLQAWNGDARLALMEEADPDKWKFVFPTPSANLWVDHFALVRGTQHPGAAHAFMNAMLDPEISFNEMDYIGYQTGVAGLEERGREADLDFSELLFPSDEVLNRLTPTILDDANTTRTAILNEMQARSAQ